MATKTKPRYYNQQLAEGGMGLSTYHGAYARLNKVMSVLEDEGALFMVVTGIDGKFYPMVVINNRNEWLAGWLPNKGIWVTNG